MTTRIGKRAMVSSVQAASPTFAGISSSAGEILARALWRAFEIVSSAAALVLSIPVLLLLAIIIRLDSPGPALFRQIRLGRHFRPFTFYKLRTLYADARERWPELYAYDYSPEEIANLRFKREEDPRVTRVGRWLRKTTLDELPNFWNVLAGDLALVGPRPDIPEMVAYYTEEQKRKLSVKPGITGLAQTHGRGRLGFQETLQYDLEYVDQKSILLDVKILLRTVRLLISSDGAF